MKKIKILRIITRLNIGGPAIHAVLLTKEFNNDEFESTLLSGAVSECEGDMGYIAGIYNVKPLYITDLKREINPIKDFVAFFRIFKYIREFKPDIVHTHTAKAGTLGRVAAILAGVPVKVHTFHGHVFHGYFDKALTNFFIFIERFLARFTDVIIAISPSQRDEIVEKYKITATDKCHIVRLGFDLDKFLNLSEKRDTLRKKFNFKKDDILIGIVGRLVPIKNHKMFIDAAAYVNEHAGEDLKNKTKFVVVGDGEMKEELLAYSKNKGLEDKIVFSEWIKDIEEAYADLDIVALTSINEGTPVSLIEAMTSGKPVVSTDVGGVKDAVGEIGIAVKSGDYKTMGDRMLDLVSSCEKRNELGCRGQELVKGKYSKERLIAELGDLYKELTKTKRGAGDRYSSR